MQWEIKIPAMGESISEVTLGTFFKPSGSLVRENEEILEVETDKVNQVLYAPGAGVLVWTAEPGAHVAIGTTVGRIEAAGAAAPSTPTPAAPKPPQPPSAPPPPRTTAVPLPLPVAPPPKPLISSERETRTRMTRIRQTIGARLVEALHTTAALTTFNEVDMSAVLALRSQMQESFIKKYQVKLGFMSFFVKAVVEGLKHVPTLNAYIDQDILVQRHYYDIGIAVSTDRGLMVPVVRGCDTLSFGQIEQQIARYAEQARARKLQISDLEGGGFTLTNGGVFGSLLSTPVLNPPQSGILGMHKIQERVVVVDHQMVIRPMMYLALTYDHRIVDGKEAVTFLVKVKEFLENPSLFFDVQESIR